VSQRPILYVLAGVNGAGKSSVGGHLLQRAGLTWFDPDVFAREFRADSHCSVTASNAAAWAEGMRRLASAIRDGNSFAFETTLGGNTVPARIRDAARSHDVLMWFCGLASPELHVARVRARVQAGGHDIPENKTRERYPAALKNLIGLIPVLAHLRVHDNSREAGPEGVVPDPQLLLDVRDGRLHHPLVVEDLQRTPDWAKPLVAAALAL
jgi:predicted ABC-type ATPase